jgi:hypothetical protein
VRGEELGEGRGRTRLRTVWASARPAEARRGLNELERFGGARLWRGERWHGQIPVSIAWAWKREEATILGELGRGGAGLGCPIYRGRVGEERAPGKRGRGTGDY